ncbi:hypothetical protein [Corallococcus sp. AB038B]|uniref:hypothetical protein n=1 Tax=Corallococcus sp. AB038B TaxID=2316718 RepID=UPI001F2AAEEA|nr:hypothetical protein [Corallococcus sp. AB038B]
MRAERKRPGILKYGLYWSTKANIAALEKLAKTSNQSVCDYISKRVEQDWLGYTRKEDK